MSRLFGDTVVLSKSSPSERSRTSLEYIVISENLTLLIDLSYFGIVCQKLLFVLTLWIHLRIDWINFGKIKKFCTILKLTFSGSRSQVSAILD